MENETITIECTAQMAADGSKWEAVLIAPGISKSTPAFNWTDQVLMAAAPLFEGTDINAYEVGPGFFGHVPAGKEDAKKHLIANKAGSVHNVRFMAGAGLVGDINFTPKHMWIAETLQKNPDFLGLSVDVWVKAPQTESPITPTAISGVSSVDIVTRPAAGGKFLRAVAGMQPDGGGKMKEKLIESIKKKRPDLLEGQDVEKLTDDEVLVLSQQAMSAAPEPEKKAEPVQHVSQSMIAEQIMAATKEVEDRAKCGRMLDRVLMESNLPDLAKERIRGTLEGGIFTEAELSDRVKSEREYLAKMSVPGFGDMPDQSVKVGPGSLEKIQMAVDHMFGLRADDIRSMQSMERLNYKPVFSDLAGRKPEDMDGVSRIHGLGELYELLSGDGEVSGRFMPAKMSQDMRATQGLNSGSFSYVLGNTMARRLVKDYMEADKMESLLVSLEKSVKDFRTQEAINVGYFGMLSSVNPETEDYAEIAPPTDEESTYTIGQKGNILAVTRKMIINDDISVLTRLVSRLGKAARYTHAYYVWSFFTGNATCSDGTAWFTSGHGNHTTSALTHTTALTAYKALANMTEKDSGLKIGWLPGAGKPTLVVPVALMETGQKIAMEDFYYTSNDLTTKVPNPLKGLVNSEIIPIFTDATDWGLLMPTGAGDMVEMGYLNGRKEPEMFVANQPSNEMVFTGDKIRYKIRHEYAGAVVDYRTGYKGVVA